MGLPYRQIRRPGWAMLVAIALSWACCARLPAASSPPPFPRDGVAVYHWSAPPGPESDPASELLAALYSNDADKVAGLLLAHADLIEHRYDCHYRIHYPQGGWPGYDEPLTPLQIAAGFDDAAVVAAVCRYRPNLEVRDNQGRTPLWVALALRHDVAIGRVLLDAGADLQAKGEYGGTVWSEQFRGDVSEGGPQLEVIQFLLDSGLDPRAQEVRPETMLKWTRYHWRLDCGGEGFVHGMTLEQQAQATILYRYAWRWPRLLVLLAFAAAVGGLGRQARQAWRQRRADWLAAGSAALAARCDLTAAGKLVFANLTPTETARYAQAFGEQRRLGPILALYWVGLIGGNLMVLVDPVYTLDIAHQFLLFSLVVGFLSLVLALAESLAVRWGYLFLQALTAVLLVAGGLWLAVEPWWVVGPVEISLAGLLAAVCGLVRLWWLRRQFAGIHRLWGLNWRIRKMAQQMRVDGEQTDVEAQAGWDQGGP